MIIIDNYDSFTYNIVEYLNILNKDIEIYKNDEITIEELKKKQFNSIILSPGPSTPTHAGITLDVIAEFYKTKKILGVCLGHQAIAQYFGSKIIKAKEPMHGKCSKIYFNDNEPLFEGFKQGFYATRYHSLIIKDTPSEIETIASTDNDIIMGIKLKGYPVYGVQFHPEAILTENGINIFRNFIKIKG